MGHRMAAQQQDRGQHQALTRGTGGPPPPGLTRARLPFPSNRGDTPSRNRVMLRTLTAVGHGHKGNAQFRMQATETNSSKAVSRAISQA